MGYPLYCELTGPDAPWWDDEVCCSGAKCVEVGTAGCPDDLQKYSCRHAEIDTRGQVTCLFEVPSYCDDHSCPAGFQPQPQSMVICCYAEGCFDSTDIYCYGDAYWCDSGVSNLDGTVTCFDQE
ncbi:hypothetical protein DB30_01707 [Enhygromyxa salina]|uniref:Uncharacterized protein n=1 Tax=Enhygromyxa salina TaxID=215803 RepID=A0A0C2A4B2_9BACT|nr:hypothetical protein DB30_01707 [Enhygromyxa salina]